MPKKKSLYFNERISILNLLFVKLNYSRRSNIAIYD